MIECRRRIDLEMLPPFPRTPDPLPCLHFIAAWGPARAEMAEAVLFALEGNRELLVRNIRPAEVRQDYIDESRADLEAVARRFAREAKSDEHASAALFGDQHERNHVAREFASIILGPNPTVGPSA